MDPQPTSAAANAAAASTRPSAFQHLLHDRAVRFAVGLAVAVAIPVAVLFYFQFRSLNALEDTSAVVLRQLSGDTAESMAGDIDEALKRPHIGMLLRSVQARLEPVDLGLHGSGVRPGPGRQPVHRRGLGVVGGRRRTSRGRRRRAHREVLRVRPQQPEGAGHAGRRAVPRIAGAARAGAAQGARGRHRSGARSSPFR